MAWTSTYCKALAMEHRVGLLGMTMHSALYWELHPIGESHKYRLLLVGISMFWWVPRHSRLSWQNLNRWAGQLNLGFSDLLLTAQAWCFGLKQTYWIWATFGLKNKDWHFALGCLGLWQKVGIYTFLRVACIWSIFSLISPISVIILSKYSFRSYLFQSRLPWVFSSSPSSSLVLSCFRWASPLHLGSSWILPCEQAYIYFMHGDDIFCHLCPYFLRYLENPIFFFLDVH